MFPEHSPARIASVRIAALQSRIFRTIRAMAGLTAQEENYVQTERAIRPIKKMSLLHAAVLLRIHDVHGG
jgi:hypothetical protein